LGQGKVLVPEVRVAVTQEEEGAGINPVGEQQLGCQVFAPGIDGEGVVCSIVVIVDVLEDGPEKGTDVEMVNAPYLTDICRVDPIAVRT